MKAIHYASLLLLLRLTLAQNTTCPSGTFQTPKGTCKICPPGTWRQAQPPRLPLDRCIPCRPGTFNPNPGAQGRDLCRRCTRNTFASDSASIKCHPCPAGTVSGTGASKCVVCKPGTELKRGSTRGCLPCEEGSYNPDRNGRCRKCPDGQTSPPRSTSIAQCTDCPPGEESYFLDPSSGCKPCSHSTFKSGRSGACSSCPRGYISNENRTACTPCPPGTFWTILRRSCKECFPKFETKGYGNYRCRRIGGSCPKAFFEDANGDCRDCERGFKLNIRKNKCEKCPSGTVSIGGVQAVCERCPPGQKPDSRQSICTCPRGHRKTRSGGCEQCPKGHFSRLENDLTYCFDCSPGTFSDVIGAVQCKPCPPGTISSIYGASKCEPCPPGTRPGLLYQSSECLSITTNCPPGFKRSGSRHFLNCDMMLCKPDADEADIGKSCALCDPGYFLNPKGGYCQECPENAISFGGLVTECQECPDGKVRDHVDGSVCSCSTLGKGMQGGKCEPCPPGTFSDFRSQACELCPPGQFSDKPGSEDCTLCPIDTIAVEEGAVRCKKCPKGTISNRRPRFSINEEGGTECIKIPA